MNFNTDFEENETYSQFLSYCTLVSLLVGKKTNIANVFLYYLTNKQLRQIFKSKLDIVSDFDAVNLFLKFDSSLYKSKYVMKYLNSTGKDKIK